LKVAIITYALNVGGMEALLFSLARELRTHGIDSTFVITDSIGPWHEWPRDNGFDMLTIMPDWWESRQSHAKQLASRLRCYDILLLNHSRPAQSAIGLFPNSTAVIAVLLNDIEDIYTVGLANHHNLDRIVAVSEKVLAEGKRYGFCSDKLLNIRNGVEVFSDYPRNTGSFAKERPLNIAFIGRFQHKQKGVLFLPGIVAKAREKGLSVYLNIVGDGQDADALQKLLMDASLMNSVKLHGALPHSEAMRLLDSADLLLMPSLFEGQPIILFEAMARGVVPVATRLVGITDNVITDGVNGFLLPPGDEDAFAESLRQLSDMKTLERMSRSSWNCALENFSLKVMARQYKELFDACIKERQNGSAPARTGTLDVFLLGKRSSIPLVFHDIWRNAKNVFKTRS